MPQELQYTFASRFDPTGDYDPTFALTLTREVLSGVNRITMKYYLNDAPILQDSPQDNLGVMRSVILAAPKRDPAILQLETRYDYNLEDATSYKENQRNLEAPWKGVYQPMLLILIHGMDTCDVLQEMPIWVFGDASDSIPLNVTVSMPRGRGKTVFPDLSVVMRRGTNDMRNCGAAPDRILPVLVELKRAISRSLTVLGYPILSNPVSLEKLANGFEVAQPQIELTAYLHLKKCTTQTHIILIAGVGPWFRAVYVDRNTVLTHICPPSEIEAARQINEVLEQADRLPGDVDPDDPPIAPQSYFPIDISDATFRAVAGDRFDRLSYLDGWSEPMMLGSPAAIRFWSVAQQYVRLMLSGLHV